MPGLEGSRQIGLFTPANTERVEREKNAAITVIIGNPPYNVGQKSENDNNQNRKYSVIDKRIRDTYAKDSTATNKNSLSDMYVKFFRWASRLKQAAAGGQLVEFDETKIREALYRPFCKQWLYFDGILNHRVYQWPKIEGQVLWLKSGGDWPFFDLAADRITSSA
jgi:predicted helicase